MHFCTVHSFIEAKSNEALRAVFASAQMVAMDGMPLVWLAHRHGFSGAQRVCGPDVMIAALDRGRAMDVRHYFLGGKPGVPERLRDRMVAAFPGLRVVGLESPPFRQMDPDEDEELVRRVNAARPDIVWVGLGSPKQEFWAADHSERLTAPVVLPVGAAFDFHSGRLKRAPGWMQRSGLEWAFRLVSEPRRLGRRYFATNLRFIWLVLRDEVARASRRKPRS
jgi:N-acetylglucosaminyldiphosphoundecaprenol N-acetyl-beta-D-mannosaminyltransferase